MKHILTVLFACLFAATLSLGAFAETQSKNLTLYNAVDVNGKTLPAGNYKVKVEETGTTAQVTFFKGNKEVASAPAQITPLAKKAGSTQVQVNNAGGSNHLDEIDFAGSTTGIRFTDVTTAAQQ
jgi:hypothetical protein